MWPQLMALSGQDEDIYIYDCCLKVIHETVKNHHAFGTWRLS